MPKAREAQTQYVATSVGGKPPAKPRVKRPSPPDAKPQFVVDDRGRKTAVILPIEEYEELLEDLHDLGVMLARRDEPTVPWEEVKRQLRADGRLPD